MEEACTRRRELRGALLPLLHAVATLEDVLCTAERASLRCCLAPSRHCLLLSCWFCCCSIILADG